MYNVLWDYKDKIDLLNDKTMEDVIRQTTFCYTQFKQTHENTKTWQDKNKNNKFYTREK